MAPELVLASSSVYRRELLGRLGLAFVSLSPDVDERPLPGEAPAALAARLAQDKAQAVARQRPGALIVASDQVADLDGQALGKPGSEDNAIRQLQACSGRKVLFHTAVYVLGPAGRESHVDRTAVHFRELSDREVREYVRRERPLDSAGAFRCEGLGIALFESIDSRDPTALIGLPLIWLSGALARAGRPVL